MADEARIRDRWLLTSHWLIPAIVLPPIAFGLTLTSALISFVIISLIFRPSSNSAPTSKRTIAPIAPRQAVTQEEKKINNDMLARRTVSFAESDRTTEGSDGSVGGLVLRASGVEGSDTLQARTAQSRPMYDEPQEVDGLSLPATPVKRASGQTGGKTVQKSPAPSMMIQRRASAALRDDNISEPSGTEGEESLDETMTGTETETGTDRE